MQNRTLQVLILVALTLTAGSAQEYQLGWGEVNKSPKELEKSYTLDWSSVDRQVDRAEPKPVVVAAQPIIRNVAPPALAPRAKAPTAPAEVRKPPSYDIALAASQYYDHYAQRYKVVRAIELQTNRNGSVTCELIENPGQYRLVDVAMRNLLPGDSYKARIIWDDGSNRTVEKTIGTFVDRKIFIDQPDYLAYSAW